jgi:serine/threonine-protein kinase RsbW
MTLSEWREFAARRASLTEAIAFVEAFGAAAAIDRADRLRLTLVVEELFTNTVEHGHRGDHDSAVAVGLQVDGDRLVVHYEDAAPPFDPTEALDASTLELPPDERPVGGLGLQLVAQFACEIDYRRIDARNRLRLVLLRRG